MQMLEYSRFEWGLANSSPQTKCEESTKHEIRNKHLIDHIFHDTMDWFLMAAIWPWFAFNFFDVLIDLYYSDCLP